MCVTPYLAGYFSALDWNLMRARVMLSVYLEWIVLMPCKIAREFLWGLVPRFAKCAFQICIHRVIRARPAKLPYSLSSCAIV